MSLAIFDLDNTLLNGDSDHAWGEFLVQQGLVDAQAYKEANDGFFEQYKNGSLDIAAYLRFSLQPLTQHSLPELQQWHEQFMHSMIKPMALPKAFALIEQHRAQDDYLLIITATNSFVTRPIAQWLGVDDILASEAELVDGRYTGNIVGTPCFQGGKVTRLQEWLQTSGHTLAGSSFYSDSHNDLPLLRMVDKPVVVDGDATLLQVASENGWPCISLR